MSQVDSLEIQNQTFPSFRADLNATLAALGSQNSGTTEPTTPVPYMLWADTAAGVLKQRNGGNNAWIELGPLNSPNLGMAPWISNIATLRTIVGAANQRINLLGHAATGDGGGGLFYWDGASSAADDNGMTILPTGHTGTGRWRRVIFDFVSVRWFGAKGDGTTDDLAAIQAAINWVKNNGRDKRVVADGTFAVSNKILIHGCDNMTIEFGVLRPHSSFPALPTAWWNATPLLEISTANTIVRGVKIEGGGKAHGISQIAGSINEIEVSFIESAIIGCKVQAPGVANSASNTYNLGTIRYCYIGFYQRGNSDAGGTHCEGNIIRSRFIYSNNRAGVILGEYSQYAYLETPVDFNGRNSVILQVSNLTNISEWLAVTTSTSNKSGNVLGWYTEGGNNFVIVGLTFDAMNSNSGISAGQTLSGGSFSATINAVTTTNDGSTTAFYFDVIDFKPNSAFSRSTLMLPFYNGLVGTPAAIHSSVSVWGSTARGTRMNLAGIQLTASPGFNAVIRSLAHGVDMMAYEPGFDRLYFPKNVLTPGTVQAQSGVFTSKADVNMVSGTPANLYTFSSADAGKIYLLVGLWDQDKNLRAASLVFVDVGGVVLHAITAVNMSHQVSGWTVQAVHNTGGTKVHQTSLLRLR